MIGMNLPLAATVCKNNAWNPLCGVAPNPSAWGGDLSSKVNQLLGGVWWLVLVAITIAVLVSLAKWGWAKGVSHSESDLAAGTQALRRSSFAFAAAVGVSIILTAAINFVQ